LYEKERSNKQIKSYPTFEKLKVRYKDIIHRGIIETGITIRKVPANPFIRVQQLITTTATSLAAIVAAVQVGHIASTVGVTLSGIKYLSGISYYLSYAKYSAYLIASVFGAAATYAIYQAFTNSDANGTKERVEEMAQGQRANYTNLKKLWLDELKMENERMLVQLSIMRKNEEIETITKEKSDKRISEILKIRKAIIVQCRLCKFEIIKNNTTGIKRKANDAILKIIRDYMKVLPGDYKFNDKKSMDDMKTIIRFFEDAKQWKNKMESDDPFADLAKKTYMPKFKSQKKKFVEILKQRIELVNVNPNRMTGVNFSSYYNALEEFTSSKENAKILNMNPVILKEIINDKNLLKKEGFYNTIQKKKVKKPKKQTEEDKIDSTNIKSKELIFNVDKKQFEMYIK